MLRLQSHLNEAKAALMMLIYQGSSAALTLVTLFHLWLNDARHDLPQFLTGEVLGLILCALVPQR